MTHRKRTEPGEIEGEGEIERGAKNERESEKRGREMVGEIEREIDYGGKGGSSSRKRSHETVSVCGGFQSERLHKEDTEIRLELLDKRVEGDGEFSKALSTVSWGLIAST